jgi:hypothetical protein
MGYYCVCGANFCNICHRYCGNCGKDTAVAFANPTDQLIEKLIQDKGKLEQTIRELNREINKLKNPIEPEDEAGMHGWRS